MNPSNENAPVNEPASSNHEEVDDAELNNQVFKQQPVIFNRESQSFSVDMSNPSALPLKVLNTDLGLFLNTYVDDSFRQVFYLVFLVGLKNLFQKTHIIGHSVLNIIIQKQ